METRISKAIRFATDAHGDQKRKYTNEPYINHPISVANRLQKIGAHEDVVIAGILHDVIEDTGKTYSDIAVRFGVEIADLVWWVSDISRPWDGNRETRKAMDKMHIAKAPPGAKTLKLADLIDNSSTILQYDKDFAKVFLKEKESLLEVLKEGDATLYKEALQIVISEQEKALQEASSKNLL